MGSLIEVQAMSNNTLDQMHGSERVSFWHMVQGAQGLRL